MEVVLFCCTSVQHHLLLPGKPERLGPRQLPRPPATAPDSWVSGWLKISLWFSFPPGKTAAASTAEGSFPSAWLSASVTATSPGDRCLGCLGMLAQGPWQQPLRGEADSAAQHDLHRRWWNMQEGKCMAWWRMCQLRAKLSAWDCISEVIHIASDQTSP